MCREFGESSHRHFGRSDGAQGRDRTTDTAIFSRMLYQLSYLGIPVKPATQLEGAAVYSQAGPLCPPCFAWRLRMAQPCEKPTAKHVRHSPKGEAGRSRKSMKIMKFSDIASRCRHPRRAAPESH